MTGEKDLKILLQSMKPEMNEGEYVFCTAEKLPEIDLKEIVCFFKEKEGITLIIRKELADQLNLSYGFIASWITLKIHSSLEAVGLTAAFSKALTSKNISCNVVAGYFHDHIFVAAKDAEAAMKELHRLSEEGI
ncbi:ACT domain-containing protein [Chryseobacterium sp.]|uniref:ACT domain-containing protein n=1 Tax=Chryseobacterium sp. TaxID=1871047 RepID=UPI00289E918F|nr:ACT domain-containing protein [Chryseobacterium sp.]